LMKYSAEIEQRIKSST